MQLTSIIEKILSQPTAPFRETWVYAALEEICRQNKLRYVYDDFGNLWVGAKSVAALKKSKLVFVAHTDHPGFVILSSKIHKGKTLLRTQWLGGGPTDLKDHAVEVFSTYENRIRIPGSITKVTQGKRGADKVEIELDMPLKVDSSFGSCLQYKDAPCGVALSSKKFWMSKAIDDLMGASCMLHAYLKSSKPASVALLFSRAEESGFHGALYALEKGLLSPAVAKMISVESSAFRPKAMPGDGPIVRLGDFTSTFHPVMIQWMKGEAAALQKRDRSFQFQKQLMDGGSCEATAFQCFGFQVGGISIPLVNYHNIDSAKKLTRPQVEMVSQQDCENTSKLITQLINSATKPSFQHINKKAFRALQKTLCTHSRLERKTYGKIK